MTARTFIEALRTLERDGDVDPIVALFADDAQCDNITATEPFRGRDGVRRFWREDRSLFDTVESSFQQVVEDDGGFALQWTRHGVTQGGAEVDYAGCSIAAVADGRITRFTAYYDPTKLGDQAL